MNVLVLFLIVLYAARAEAQEFLCGYSLMLEANGTQDDSAAARRSLLDNLDFSTTQTYDADYRSGTIHPVIVFGTFKDDKEGPVNLNAPLLDREGKPNNSVKNLLDIEHKGSLAHYFFEMSKGTLTLAAPPSGIKTKWYESDYPSVDYYVKETLEAPDPCLIREYRRDSNTTSLGGGMPGFVEQVLANADEDINFGEIKDGKKVYDQNGDGVVDLVVLFFPPEFLKACPTAGLGTALKVDRPPNRVSYETDEGELTTARVIVSSVAQLNPLDPDSSVLFSFPFMVGIVAHEYGHMMGLPDLYASAWKGIGTWGLMGRGAIGWLHNSDPNLDLVSSLTSVWDGPNSMSAWSRRHVEWITPETVAADMSNVEIPAVNPSESKVLRIPVLESDTEYFLVANRQNTHSETGVGSYYDDYAPASGLAIWHVDDNLFSMYPLANRNELHKFVDLECADGLFSDTGDADSVTGFDDIDRGNRGDSTDLWDGVDYTVFTPSTNPSTMGYAVFPDPNDPEKELTEQRVRTGIAVHNIQALDGGVMQADIYRNYWSGPITEDTVWNIWDGRIITVGGDVTIRSGVTLTIMPGVEVRFIANSDDTGSGNDNVLSELIVEDGGRLIAGKQLEGSTLLPVTFRSSTNDPMPREWYGFHVESGGHATFTNVTIRDAVHCIPTPANSAESLPDNLTFDNLTLRKLRNCGTPPTIEGDSMPEFPEDSTEPVAAYMAEDAEGDAVEWSLGTDADEAAFVITSAGELDFAKPPDFETLNGDSLFSVTVRATDRQQAFTDYPVTVTVRNVDEESTVVLSPLPPEVDRELTATLTDRDNIVSVDRWTWERAASATAADSDWTMIAETVDGEPTNHYTPTLEDVSWVLRATAYYADGHGPNKSETSGSTVAVVGPELDGPESLTFVEHGTFVDENGEEVVPTYTVSGVDGAVTWSLSGADAAAFDLAADSGGASLSFSETEPPNFEKPRDDDGKNTYELQVVATLTDGASEPVEDPFANLFAAFQGLSDEAESAQASSSALTKAVVVTVENGDDEGAVALPSTARVGQSLTARLVDEDEDLTDMVWTWLADGDDMRTASGDTTDSYEPQPADEGRALQAQVRYNDPFGAKTVVSAPTAAVQPAGVVSLSPDPPRLCQPGTAELSGPAQISGETWTWERRQQGSDEWHFLRSASASDVAPSASAEMYHSFHSNSGKRSRYEPTVQDTNWVLRATVSWDEHEVSSPDSAPVRAGVPNRLRSLEGEGRATEVVLSWQTPYDCGSEITGYEYQHRLARETQWNPSWTPIDGSTKETTSHPVEDLAYDEMHTFEVRAVNAEGEGAAARTQATTGCPTPVIVGPDTLSVKENHVAQLARYTVEDTRCGQPNWSLAGPDARHFSLFQRKLTVKRGLNYEQPQDANMDNYYQLHVVAHDKHDPSKADQLDVQVEVTDVNEPLVLYGAGSLAIPENWTGEVTTYTAADPEGATIYWKLKGPDASRFRLAISSPPSATAYLHLDQALNFEQPSSADDNNAYQLYIEASDGLHTDTIQVFVRVRLVTVHVTNVNERPWVHGPSRLSFAENDTGFVGSFHAYDPEGDSLGWSLGGAAGPFRIIGTGRSSSRLHVVRPMDYEAILEDAEGERAYQLDITVRDEGSLSSSVRTKVVVLDVNEPPVLEGSVNVSIYGRDVDTYTAHDPEGTPITWSLSGSDAAVFRLSGRGGTRRLYFDRAPAPNTSYSVTVVAQDETGLAASLAVSVSVLEREEPTPTPSDTPGEDAGTVRFASQPQEGLSVTAELTDPDGGITGTQWTWTSDGLSVIMGSGGETHSYTPTNSDVGKELSVEVRYHDGEGTAEESASTSATVLSATDTPACVVNKVSGPASVSYTEGRTHSVGTYAADVLDCGALSWSLGGSDAGHFHLSGSTLYFNNPPSAPASYSVTITVEEDASGASASLSVSITVVDDDDGGGTGLPPDQPGSISLTPPTQPQVGKSITAMLTDPDGVKNFTVEWRWHFFSDTPMAQAASAQDYPSLETFTPTAVLEGIRLQAQARYDDTHRQNRRAQSVITDPVLPAAAKPVSPAVLPISLTAQAYPNPFNPTTTLRLGLPVRSLVALTLYNIAGQRVRTLLNTTMEAGYYSVLWNGRDEQGQPVSSGVYLYRVQAGPQVVVGKMALAR